MTPSDTIGTKKEGLPRRVSRESPTTCTVPRDGIEPSTRGFSGLVQASNSEDLAIHCSNCEAVARTTSSYEAVAGVVQLRPGRSTPTGKSCHPDKNSPVRPGLAAEQGCSWCAWRSASQGAEKAEVTRGHARSTGTGRNTPPAGLARAHELVGAAHALSCSVLGA